ncbi:MAG: arylsulfatase [Rhodothermales bacterium]|nr:arylsulfatase [Rhodothermales bacterium]
MNRRIVILLSALLLAGCDTPPQPPPNIVFIMADDLGYGDIGVYGQNAIQTPNLDRMAAEGMRFTQFYAGSTVCAPSRAVLMTGKHIGHNDIRGNLELQPVGQQPLPAANVTLAEVLQQAGYATGLIGKWGLGHIGTEGHPNRQGFDHFFGYLDQRHAHNFYTEFLFRNEERVTLPGNRMPEPKREDGAGEAVEKGTYSHDLFAEEALGFIDAHQDEPFFLYLALTIPHANNEAGPRGMEVPDYGDYGDRGWPASAQGLAAMVTRMDRDIGRLLERLRERGLDERTLVIFTSDNGPHAEGGNDPDYFDSNGPFRGIKRSLYEGGIRVPMIARWPGRIAAGAVSEHVGYHGDFITTFAALVDQPAPDSLDSISLLPTLLGQGEQSQHPYLYWAFYEQGSRQAVRAGALKAIREPMFSGPVALYDLTTDPGETTNRAGEHPEEAKRLAALMDEAHVAHSLWDAN